MELGAAEAPQRLIWGYGRCVLVLRPGNSFQSLPSLKMVGTSDLSSLFHRTGVDRWPPVRFSQARFWALGSCTASYGDMAVTHSLYGLGTHLKACPPLKWLGRTSCGRYSRCAWSQDGRALGGPRCAFDLGAEASYGGLLLAHSF